MTKVYAKVSAPVVINGAQVYFTYAQEMESSSDAEREQNMADTVMGLDDLIETYFAMKNNTQGEKK